MPQKKLRVVHILGTLSYGGLQLRVLNLIKELPSFSHIVVFQAEEKGLLHPQYASVSDVEQCVYQRGRTLDFFNRLRKLLQEKDPDVILAHLFGNHTLVALAGFLSGVPATFPRTTQL